MEDDQKERFLGLTIRELMDLDAITERELKMATS
jgi:hypothetical protein